MSRLSTIVRPIRKRSDSPLNNRVEVNAGKAETIKHSNSHVPDRNPARRNLIASLLDRITPALDIMVIDLDDREVMSDLEYGRDVEEEKSFA
jgi:hypothetical protein